MTPDLSKADDKLASLDMVLKSDSGFRSTSKGDRISANQWRDIMFIIADAEAYRKMRAADEMLAALEGDIDWLDALSQMSIERDMVMVRIRAHRELIAKALGRTPNEIGDPS